ncbi:hypothetical protein L7F22_021790 [Adiantum nelumboides]|nr:hypothetical protein [Adiantum nelumboides]
MALYLTGGTPQLQGLHMPIDRSPDLLEQEYVDDTMLSTGRQGCPLASYLFPFFAEMMASYLRGKIPQLQGLHMPVDGSPDLLKQEFCGLLGLDDVCRWGEQQGLGETCKYLGFRVGLEEIAETYEKEEALAEAIDFYEKAAELYDGEESTSQGNQCKLKVAQFAAVLEQYEKAVEIFESVASHSMNNNLTRYSVKGYLLNAGLCRLVGGDSIAISNALEKYQEMDPSFSNSRECKLLSDLAASIEEEDVDKFTDAVKEFDNMTRLDQWKTTILLKAKNALKDLAHQEDFT